MAERRANRNYIRHLETIEELLENGAGGGGTPYAVKYTAQSLSSSEQSQARTNIGAAASSALSGKQDTLVSGTNIKTVGGQSLLGSGNVTVNDTSAVKFDAAQSLTTAQKEQARQNIGAISADEMTNMEYVTAAIRPEASANTMGKIYMIGPDANDEYERYFTQEVGGVYSWVPLGSTEIDLSGYATDDEVAQLEHEVDDLFLDVNNADLDIADGNGNVLVRFAEGHLKTKNFDSKEVDAVRKDVNDKATIPISLDLSSIGLHTGAILVDGSISSVSQYRYTDPVHFENGGLIRVKYNGGTFSPVSLTDELATSYTPLYKDSRPIAEDNEIFVNIPEDSYVAFCYRYEYVFEVSKCNDVKTTFLSNYPYTVMQTGKYIDRYATIVSGSQYFLISSPIHLVPGDTINVFTRGGLMTVIASCDENGNLLSSLVYSDYTDGEVQRNYHYTADTDMYVVFCGYNRLNDIRVDVFNDNTGIFRRVELLEEKTESNYHNGIYLYPFRAIVGKRVVLYKDSIACGLKPSCNYQVDCVKGDDTQNYTRNALSYLPTTTGAKTINVRVTDGLNNKITKQITVTSSNMPSSKLSNSGAIDVLWMGDSLIAFNGNLIGAEWYRMLATNDSETHIDETTKAKQLPTYNVCPGKLNLAGEQSWETRYMYAYTLDVLMTGKRTDQYNPNIGRTTSATKNPWYNPNSSQPDEVGSDGFNKRVDLQWYFDNACGEGNYPKLFYLAIGVNDIAEGGWKFDDVPSVTNKFVLLCKKIKAECDAIAGADSGIKIKVLNHQTYPLYNMYNYELDQLQQRLIYKLLYDSYYDAINDPDNGISGYVELIDCASRFDWRVGYTEEEIESNPRYDGKQDIFIEECCHINNVGAYNYADALIDDFLADSYFD